MYRSAIAIGLLAMFLSPALLFARQNILLNGSMESGEGPGGIDQHVAADWTEFGVNVERSDTVNLTPPGDGHALKAFGDSDSNAAGAFQEISGFAAGQSVTATVYLYSPGFDKLGGSGNAGIVLEFLNMFGGTIGGLHELYPFTAGSPADTWVEATVGPLTAPTGTAKVRVSCKLNWTPGSISGAVYWDDVDVHVGSGANTVVNGDFETAGHGTGQSAYGIDEWIGFEDQERSEDVALDGAASLKLGTNKSYSGLWQNMTTLFEGDHLYALAYALNPAGDPLTDNSGVGIKLEFDPSVDVPPPVENLAFDENSPVNTWTEVNLSATVPDGAAIARIVCIYVASGTTEGAVYYDSAVAERSSFPGLNQLTNESFENGPGGLNGIDDWTEFSSPPTSQAQKSCFEVETPPGGGFCSARAAGQAVAGLFQEIDVVPGETLDVSALLYTPDWEPFTGGTAGIKIEWAAGGVPDDVDIGGPTNTIGASAPTDTWVPVYIDYVMPTGSSALTRFVNIIARNNALSGTVYMDACEAVLLNVFDGSDADGDDDQDMSDFTWLQRTYTGAGAGMLPFNGIVFDQDDDDDIDLTDWNFFRPRITGPAAE